MRIDQLRLQNFRCFEDQTFNFHPQFNLLIGTNGKGKSSLIQALAIMLSSWLGGLREHNQTLNIDISDVRLATLKLDGSWKCDGAQRTDGRVRKQDSHGRTYLERQYPTSIEAEGYFQDKLHTWHQSTSGFGHSSNFDQGKNSLLKLAKESDQTVREGNFITLPLVACYGTNRLQQDTRAIRDASRIPGPEVLYENFVRSRFNGYIACLEPRISVSDLVKSFARDEWAAFQKKGAAQQTSLIKQAVISCLEDEIHDLFFDAEIGELLIVTREQGTQPFSNLSDGQRTMLAMIADIAQRAEILNSNLGDNALLETPGVVLIDELDLHLHPKWQQRVVEDLRRTFPKIQFICTTHSPFLIQSLRSGEELISLDSQPLADLGHLSVDQIAEGVMGVADSSVSLRYSAMRAAAGEYLATLETLTSLPPEQQKAYTSKLDSTSEAFAANPAFQAFLEMKRVATLGK